MDKVVTRKTQTVHTGQRRQSTAKLIKIWLEIDWGLIIIRYSLSCSSIWFSFFGFLSFFFSFLFCYFFFKLTRLSPSLLFLFLSTRSINWWYQHFNIIAWPMHVIETPHVIVMTKRVVFKAVHVQKIYILQIHLCWSSIHLNTYTLPHSTSPFEIISCHASDQSRFQFRFDFNPLGCHGYRTESGGQWQIFGAPSLGKHKLFGALWRGDNVNRYWGGTGGCHDDSNTCGFLNILLINFFLDCSFEQEQGDASQGQTDHNYEGVENPVGKSVYLFGIHLLNKKNGAEQFLHFMWWSCRRSQAQEVCGSYSVWGVQGGGRWGVQSPCLLFHCERPNWLYPSVGCIKPIPLPTMQ